MRFASGGWELKCSMTAMSSSIASTFPGNLDLSQPAQEPLENGLLSVQILHCHEKSGLEEERDGGTGSASFRFLVLAGGSSLSSVDGVA